MINFYDNEKEEDKEADGEPTQTVPTIIAVHTGICTDESTIEHVKKDIDIVGEPELNAGTYITPHIYNQFIQPFINKYDPKHQQEKQVKGEQKDENKVEGEA